MTEEHRIIAYYDGQCGLCHLAVVFLLRRDRSGLLYFAPLQSTVYREFASAHKLVFAPKSILVYDPKTNRLIAESTAVLLLLKYCGPLWSLVSRAGLMIPNGLRDGVYRFIARIRHRFFRIPPNLYPDVPQVLQARLLRG